MQGTSGAGHLTLLDVFSRRAQESALEVVPDEGAAGFEQLVERFQQAALGRFSGATLGLNAFAHVAVEQVYCLSPASVNRPRRFLADPQQPAPPHPCPEQL